MACENPSLYQKQPTSLWASPRCACLERVPNLNIVRQARCRLHQLQHSFRKERRRSLGWLLCGFGGRVLKRRLLVVSLNHPNSHPEDVTGALSRWQHKLKRKHRTGTERKIAIPGGRSEPCPAPSGCKMPTKLSRFYHTYPLLQSRSQVATRPLVFASP
jgi:hypothetical protein